MYVTPVVPAQTEANPLIVGTGRAFAITIALPVMFVVALVVVFVATTL